LARSPIELFEYFKATKRKVTIHGKLYYLVEGDLLLDEAKLLAYAHERAALEATPPPDLPVEPLALVGVTDPEGRKVRWKKGLVLTYTVVKRTFPDETHYQEVVEAMAAATADWEATCGVNFRHEAGFDTAAASDEPPVIFQVELVNAGGQFIAAAFFPNDPPRERRMVIDPSYFAADLPFSQVGVLRHELGHVLGFRHEHIRSGAPPLCPNEPLADTIDLTEYDPRSVMHYFCGGVGDRELKITELDRRGAQLVYGPPDAEVIYYE
jgi:hypothetical protein